MNQRLSEPFPWGLLQRYVPRVRFAYAQLQNNKGYDMVVNPATVLTLIDGVRIVVPDSLDRITPYILREQLDFFEDELKFVRTLVQAGQNVIDIGANYGVYTLPMAAKIGPKGHVWAFEPASSTAQFLSQGIKANAFENVTLLQKAVSSQSGSAHLSLQHNSELNSIMHDQDSAAESETVSLVTLDECMDRFHWRDIDLIKIDAEGEENNILKGGHRFFADRTPLVQFELRKDASTMNFGLIKEFAALGYDSYRLVPGLDVLVPFSANVKPDPYLLNLFCCKGDRASQLSKLGVLVRAADILAKKDQLDAVRAQIDAGANYHWRLSLAHLPYAVSLSPAWRAAEKDSQNPVLIQALSLYARSRDKTLSALERYRALESSFLALKQVCDREPIRLRLASLARVAHDYGERASSVGALKQLLALIRQAGIDPQEPFLAPLERFESIPTENDVARWLVAGVLEQLELREWYSTFYAGPSARGRLEDIHRLALGSPEMNRRLDLVRRRINEANQKKLG
jgi:FkbM family methyltransferase